jgi:hypothetical protein
MITYKENTKGQLSRLTFMILGVFHVIFLKNIYSDEGRVKGILLFKLTLQASRSLSFALPLTLPFQFCFPFFSHFNPTFFLPSPPLPFLSNFLFNCISIFFTISLFFTIFIPTFFLTYQLCTFLNFTSHFPSKFHYHFLSSFFSTPFPFSLLYKQRWALRVLKRYRFKLLFLVF